MTNQADCLPHDRGWADRTERSEPWTSRGRAGTCHDVRRLQDFLATAIRHAMSGRWGPAFLDVPLDVQFAPAPQDARAPERYRTEARPQGDPDLVKQALRLLQDADRPIVFAG